ncbi:MAG: YpdA family putative bacillithiol disulfide reductase [Longimicrobiales bacterium]
MTVEGPFDVAVIGAGPCGLATGIAAKRAGISAILIDKGCVVSSISGYPTHMTFFSTPARLEIGGVPFVIVGDKPTRREALRYYQRLARQFELDVRQYHAVTAAAGSVNAFEVTAVSADEREHTYAARNIVVATGYFDSPNMLGIPGESLAKVMHSYREGHVFYDTDCIVVGGGNSAVDAAIELAHWGARVTIVHFGPELDPNVKPWVRPDIDARMNAGQVATHFGSRLAEVRPGSALIEHIETGTVTELRNDFVLAMTGYMPKGVLLRSLGVEFDPDTGKPIHNVDTMETNVPGVFIAGVLSAGNNANKVFIENGRNHGFQIVASLTAS